MAEGRGGDFSGRLRDVLLKTWRGLRRLRLRNRDFSLITNNCIAGIIYHDLGLPFLTPTINLFFEDEDFFRFAGSLEHYLRCGIEELRQSGISDPHTTSLRKGSKAWNHQKNTKGPWSV